MSLFGEKEQKTEEKPEEKIEQEKPELLGNVEEKKEVPEEDSEEENFPKVITENQLINWKLDEILKRLE